jgi:hypothetical protein
MLLYRINTDEYTHILLKHYFISALYHSVLFQRSKRYPQGVQQMHFISEVNKIIHQM